MRAGRQCLPRCCPPDQRKGQVCFVSFWFSYLKLCNTAVSWDSQKIQAGWCDGASGSCLVAKWLRMWPWQKKKNNPQKSFWFTGSFDVLQLAFGMENTKGKEKHLAGTLVLRPPWKQPFSIVSLLFPAPLKSCWSCGIPCPDLYPLDDAPALQSWPSWGLDVALVLFCAKTSKPRCFSGICIDSCVPKVSRLQGAKGRGSAWKGSPPSLYPY